MQLPITNKATSIKLQLMAGAHQSSLSCVVVLVILSSTSLSSTACASRGMLQQQSSSTQAQQFLDPHNALRRSLGLPPLRWSSALASYAQWWAGQRRGDCALVHSDSNYGENIFWGGGAGWQAGDAVAAWAAERSYYDYESNTCQPDEDCTHYTQMVWRQSQWLGCARVVCVTGDTFITCNYDPHGNILGQKPF